MAIITTDNKHYSDIAMAIREVSGSVETLKPSEMATMISGLKTAKAVEMTMTQSCTHGGEAMAILDSLRDENADVSVLVYKGSSSVERQLGVIVTLLIEGNRYYFGMRYISGVYQVMNTINSAWNMTINIGDKYTLYEI